MYILDEDDLFDIINNKELVARFKLTERQAKIVKLHILKGFTFEIIAGIEKASIAAVHDVYTDAIKKIRKQLIKILKERAEKPAKINAASSTVHYIGGDGETGDRVLGAWHIENSNR